MLLARSFLACFTNGLKPRNTCLVKCYCENIYIYIIESLCSLLLELNNQSTGVANLAFFALYGLSFFVIESIIKCVFNGFMSKQYIFVVF